MYDTLNDDDDEIRDLSAATVSSMLSTPLTALAAREKLAEWLHGIYGSDTLFSWEVLYRITGTLSPIADVEGPQLLSVKDQLEVAMRLDNALFVEEEQNLFVDEIREAKLWTQVFQQYSQVWNVQTNTLVTWVMDGLVELLLLEGLEEGSLGYASNPAAFALMFRLLTCTNAVLEHLEGSADSITKRETLKNIMSSLDRFVQFSTKNRVHESLLFVVTGQPTTLRTYSSAAPNLTALTQEKANCTPYQRLKTII